MLPLLDAELEDMELLFIPEVRISRLLYSLVMMLVELALTVDGELSCSLDYYCAFWILILDMDMDMDIKQIALQYFFHCTETVQCTHRYKR
jgi:hypothetical protein